MSYVAVKGGTEAVLNAEKLVEYFRCRGESEPITTQQIQDQLRMAVDRAMGEGAIYAPELAALALKQSEGDSLEASFLLRAFCSTVPRIDYSLPVEGVRMRVIRRVSASFKDIPGGQILGPTRDYNLRLLNTLLRTETRESIRHLLEEIEAEINEDELPENEGIFPRVIDDMRARGILAEPPQAELDEATAEPYDITRKSLIFPIPRSARLQGLARSDMGSLLTLAYSSVRGYGDIHPVLGELRSGYLPVEVAHPLTGEPVEIGEILATECEMVSYVLESEDENEQQPDVIEAGKPHFGLGYGFVFGQCEVKAMSMAMLDRAITVGKEQKAQGQLAPAANEEFVLLHSDGIEASGFTAHFKLPHYVTFQSDLKVLERAQDFQAAKYAETQAQRTQATETLRAQNESQA
uniref:Carbon-phosphorus lyase n=1 Tax=Thermosporothrix sp. COM3 TaxID=2490863 RepID=A0A455STG0_9CHLR|nr:carbon-phosphorus lyase [Thermosporothrix sp. COM3]